MASIEITTADTPTLEGIREALNVPGLNEDGALEASVLVRKGAAAELDAIVLGDGEIAVLTNDGGDTVGFRVGDGATLGGVSLSLSQVNGVLQFFDDANGDFYDVFSLSDQILTIGDHVLDISGGAELTIGCGTLSADILRIVDSGQVSVSTSQNNYSISNSLLNLSATSPLNITGLNTSARILWVYNSGANTITLVNESASSTEFNRIVSTTGGNISLTAGRVAQLVYIGNRWRAWLC